MEKRFFIILKLFLFLNLIFISPAFCRKVKDINILIQNVIKGIKENGTEVWIDTAEPTEVRKAGELGVTGGTSNPALITEAIKKNPAYYARRIFEIASKYSGESDLLLKIRNTLERLGIEEDPLSKAILLELTADLIENALKNFSGPMSWEVDPRFYNDAQAMIEEARLIYEIAERRDLDLNRIYIKIPATEMGLVATEVLISEGINVNLTLVFSIAQALEGLRRYELGIDKARERGLEIKNIHMCISPFLGRWDDFLKKQGFNIVDSEGNPVAGLYFAKLLHQRLREEIGLREKIREETGKDPLPNPPRIIMASIRGTYHVQQLLGADILTIPPKVLFSPDFASINTDYPTIDRKIPSALVEQLLNIELFQRSMKDRNFYERGGLSFTEIDQHPLVVEGNKKFIEPYQELLKLIGNILTSPQP